MKRTLRQYWIYLCLVSFSLTPVVWFVGKGGKLIDGVDTNFPLDPVVWLLRRFYAWNDVSNAGGNMSSNISGIFFHLIQTIPFILGFKLQLVQIISLIFWFSLVVFSSFIFARLITSNKLGQLIFVSIYSFNTYLFNSWENIKVSNLALVVGIPLFLSILLAFEKNVINLKKLVLFSTIASVLVTGAGINPAYFLTIISSLIIWSLTRYFGLKEKDSARKYLKGLITILAILLLVNTFWLVPTIQYLFFSSQALTNLNSIGFTDWVDSLSQNTSILNVFRVQGAWDWYSFDSITGAPLYIPYSVNYFFKSPFLLFSFLIPVLAIASLLFRGAKDKKLYSFFGIFLILGLFLGVGTHPPTGGLFIFLSKHLPFFTFFRSPWYIFTPMLTFALAGLTCLLVESVSLRVLSMSSQKNKIVFTLLVLGVAFGNLVYSYPLVTGKIFRPDIPNGFYVKFPPYVFQAEAWLNKRYIDNKDRIIGYPSGETEQYNWGYRGEESILELFSPYGVLFSPLNDTSSPVATMVADFYQFLQRGEIDSADNIANKLNVGLIFDKEDQSSLDSKLPPQITSRPANTFGMWHFYSFLNSPLPKIYSASDLIMADNSNSKASLINGLLSKNDLLVNQNDKVVSKISNVSNFSGRTILSVNSQIQDLDKYQKSPFGFSSGLSSRDLTKVEFGFNIPEGGTYQPILEKYRLEDFGIDPSKKIDVLIDGNISSLTPQQVTDSFVYFNSSNFSKGFHNIVLNLQNGNLIEGGGDMTHFNQRGIGEFHIVQTDQGKYLNISNSSNQDVSAVYNILNFDTNIPYLISTDYKQIYGNYAQTQMYQFNSSTPFKSQVQSMPNYPDWKTFSSYYLPVNSPSTLQVFLNAPFTKDPLGTTVNYANLSVRKVFTNNLYFINKSKVQELAIPQVKFHQNSAVSYSGEVTGGSSAQLLAFSENYSPDWELTLYDQQNNSLKTQPMHFIANSYANAWYLENTPSDYKFRIYYKPQTLLNISFAISLLTIIGAVILSLMPNKK